MLRPRSRTTAAVWKITDRGASRHRLERMSVRVVVQAVQILTGALFVQRKDPLRLLTHQLGNGEALLHKDANSMQVIGHFFQVGLVSVEAKPFPKSLGNRHQLIVILRGTALLDQWLYCCPVVYHIKSPRVE